VSTDQLAVSKRRRRIDRTPEFKAQIVATCLQVGVSVTAMYASDKVILLRPGPF
jgi:hypothetical protein